MGEHRVNDSEAIGKDPLDELIEETVKEIAQQYRIEDSILREQVAIQFRANKLITESVRKGQTAQQIKRTRAFKDAAKSIKKELYYKLRCYHGDPDREESLTRELASTGDLKIAEQLALLHASTRERFPNRIAFYRAVSRFIDTPKTILDIGCGVHPLMFDFSCLAPDWASYVAIDKDPKAIATLAAFAQGTEETRLRPLLWNIQEGWEPVQSASSLSRFDVAFLFKLVPVVERQEPEFLMTLRQTPAHRLVITGSKQALTKHQDIEKRERASIERFCKAMGRQVIGEFEIEEEFAIVVQ